MTDKAQPQPQHTREQVEDAVLDWAEHQLDELATGKINILTGPIGTFGGTFGVEVEVEDVDRLDSTVNGGQRGLFIRLDNGWAVKLPVIVIPPADARTAEAETSPRHVAAAARMAKMANGAGEMPEPYADGARLRVRDWPWAETETLRGRTVVVVGEPDVFSYSHWPRDTWVYYARLEGARDANPNALVARSHHDDLADRGLYWLIHEDLEPIPAEEDATYAGR